MRTEFTKYFIPFFLSLVGCALIIMWTSDIHKRKLLDNGFFKSQEDGRLFWPHLFAEYGTSICLLISAFGLITSKNWAMEFTLISLGALIYTSMSSLSWSFAKKERLIYSVPMVISFVGAVFVIIILI